ncbi:MAG TPA: hypothetical protein VLZ75_15050 [Chitinophagales bacterium]|nr:hypothetical protein [Chitinophagales bacterium]
MIENKLKTTILIHAIILLSPILWLSWYISYDLSKLNKLFFLIPFATYLFIYVISFYKRFADTKLVLISISLIFLFIELVALIGVKSSYLDSDRFRPVEQFYLSPYPHFNHKHGSFNSKIGFQWNQQEATVYKYAGEELVFNNTFKGNNYGFHTAIDFSPKKSPNVKRWIVFGDSFTDGYFLQRTWVDEINTMYKEDSILVELYSFSVNGGGIRNWNQIYHEIIDSNFEFDGVIFAVFGNDLKRKFFVLHQDEDHELYKYYDDIPSQEEVDLDLKKSLNNDLDFMHLFKKEFIYTSKICNYIFRKFLEKQFHTYYTYNQNALQNEFIISNDTLIINEKYLTDKYQNNFQLFMELINTIKDQNKEVVLLSIPELNGLKMNLKDQKTQIQKELYWIASQNELTLIDGYQLMIHSGVKSLDSLYFKNDGHWNQVGSNEFALQFYKKNQFLLN